VAEDGSLLNGLKVRAHVDLPSGERAEVGLSQTAPGRYEATAPAPDSGSYVIGLTAEGPGGFEAQQTVGFAVAYPPDFADTRPQRAFLESIAEQTGGQVLTDPQDVFTPPAVTPRVPIDIWRALLWLAACLLPVDVAVRRLVIRREDVAAFTQPIRAVARAVAARKAPQAQPAGQTMGRLLARKESTRARTAEERGKSEPGVSRPETKIAPREPGVSQPEPPPAAPSPPPVGRPAPRAGTIASRLLESKRRRRRGDG
jgi:hypothetical protein